MMKEKDIVLLFRKRIPGSNSIEELFDSLYELRRISTKKELPEKRFHPFSILKNIVFARKERGYITHITGDIHYASIGTGKNTILTVHDIGSTLRGNVIKRFLIIIIQYWIPALIVTRITVISDFSAKKLIKIIPFAKSKIIVVPNPCNDQITYFPKTFNKIKPNILHLGTKSNKNLLRVIQALANINCHLTIVGKLNEDHLKELKKYNISFTNLYDLPFSEIVKLYHKSDIISFPSTWEGFGMPIIEGNKTGRPVLTSNICSMPDVAGNAACLVNPYDVENIKDGFLKIIHDDEYREVLIKNGLKNIDRFSSTVISKQYIEIYDQIISKA